MQLFVFHTDVQYTWSYTSLRCVLRLPPPVSGDSEYRRHCFKLLIRWIPKYSKAEVDRRIRNEDSNTATVPVNKMKLKTKIFYFFYFNSKSRNDSKYGQVLEKDRKQCNLGRKYQKDIITK